MIRTLLTEAARRGIPFVGVDPEMIELDGLEGYPGCGALRLVAVRVGVDSDRGSGEADGVDDNVG